MSNADFPQPEQNLLAFIAFILNYAKTNQLKGIQHQLSELPTSFSIPPTDDFGEILNALNRLPSHEVKQLPVSLQEAIVQAQMRLKKMFGH